MIYQSIYLFASALVLAFLEVQIEGKHGWASKLPTWRPGRTWYDRLFRVFTSGKELTGYHLGVFGFAALFLHYPFFTGTEWSLQQEAWTVSIFLLFSAVWDYLWIIINPHYGVWKRQPKKDVWWHKKWIGPFPIDYYLGVFFSLAVLAPWWWEGWIDYVVLREWGIMFGIFVLGTFLTLLFVEIFRGDVDR
jgi:hypothetical protein